MKKFSILAAIFFLIFSLTTPNFVNAENNPADFGIEFQDAEKYFSTLPKKNKYKVRQRPLLIQGAMNIEIEKLVRALKNPVTYRFSNYLYIAGTLKNYPVVIARTEQGVANSAASTVIGIEKFNPVAVINQGIAGGHFPEIHLNDIVIGERSINPIAVEIKYAPAGAGIDFTNQRIFGTYAFDAASNSFQSFTEYRADSKLLEIAESVADSHGEFTTTTGTISSSDIWLSNVDYINFMHETYNSSCEEMETTAAAQICKGAGVPFIGIRTISNNATNGETFLADTAHTVQDFVLLVAEKYIQGLRTND